MSGSGDGDGRDDRLTSGDFGRRHCRVVVGAAIVARGLVNDDVFGAHTQLHLASELAKVIVGRSDDFASVGFATDLRQ